MAKHDCLPQTLTEENLAKWITDNHDDQLTHLEKTPLDEDRISELEHASSAASRSIDRLEIVKKQFMDVLNGGSPGTDEEREPFDITIPPTKGLKALKANRAFADKQLEQGHAEEEIQLYLIPWTEMSIMVAVDIEGYEWPQYTRPMTAEEINQHIPSVKVKKTKEPKQLNFMDEEEKESATPDLDL